MRLLLLLVLSAGSVFAQPIELGDRLELFVDDFLVDQTSGDLDFHVHQPEPRRVVFSADAPWEGNTSGYYGLFADGDLFRMVYRGWHHDPNDIRKEIHPEFACLATSRDGVYWERPNLDLFAYEGSKRNNIIWSGRGTHNFTAFRDDNPDCPLDARYKALGGVKGGLGYFKSADCIHWELAREEPVITEGAFDSQNLAFWDPHRKEYRAYWRIFTEGVTTEEVWKPGGYRAIRTATSQDFVHWEPHEDLRYPEGTPNQHLYTNAIRTYARAPHLFIGFPTRYLPDEGQRVEPIFMVSRDGVNFRRYDKPVIPEAAPSDRAGNRSNYMTWGLLRLPGKPDELSVYATEAYYGPRPGRVRRFVYRLDGFVSLRAGEKGGEMLSKPLTFAGSELVLNYEAREGGSVRIELQDAENGDPIAGFALEESVALDGDSVEATVAWEGGPDLEAWNGRPIRVRLVMKDADVYAMRFR